MTGNNITTVEDEKDSCNISYSDLNNLSKLVIELLESDTIKPETVKPIREL